MATTFGQTWRVIKQYSGAAPASLCRKWIQDRYTRILDRRMWSFQWGKGVWQVGIVMGGTLVSQIAATASITMGSNAVTFTAGILPSSGTQLVGWQLKIGGQMPYYNIVNQSATTLTLDGPVVEVTNSAASVQILQAYFMSEKDDFEKIIVIVDRVNQWQFRLNVSQEEIDNIDAQRTFVSPPEWTSGLGFNADYLALLPAGVTDYYGQTNASDPQPLLEMWPQAATPQPYPYIYQKRMPELVSDDDVLPGFIRSTVLQEGALADLSLWPGTEAVKNPVFNPVLANVHERKFEDLVVDMIFRDEKVTQRTLKWLGQYNNLPFGPMSARYWQSHVDTSLVTG